MNVGISPASLKLSSQGWLVAAFVFIELLWISIHALQACTQCTRKNLFLCLDTFYFQWYRQISVCLLTPHWSSFLWHLRGLRLATPTSLLSVADKLLHQRHLKMVVIRNMILGSADCSCSVDSVVILLWPFTFLAFCSIPSFRCYFMLLSCLDQGDVPRCPWRKRQEKRCKMWTQLEADAPIRDFYGFLWVSCLFQIGNGEMCAGGADYPTLQTCTSCQKAFTDGGPWKYEKKITKAYQTFLYTSTCNRINCGFL